jgi:hypothetical protein
LNYFGNKFCKKIKNKIQNKRKYFLKFFPLYELKIWLKSNCQFTAKSSFVLYQCAIIEIGKLK